MRIKGRDGNWLEGQAEVSNGIRDYFADIYSPPSSVDLSVCSEVIPHCVTIEMNDKLMVVLTESEVRKVVFELGPNKAPGPDGLNGLFFQRNWDTIKADVLAAFTSFFSNGDLGDSSINKSSDNWLASGNKSILKPNASISLVSEATNEQKQWGTSVLRNNLQSASAFEAVQKPISLMSSTNDLFWP